MPGLAVSAIRRALDDLPSRPYRAVLLKSVLATVAILAVLWAVGTRLLTGLAGEAALAHPLGLPHWLGIVEWTAGIASGLVLMVVFSFLVAPITTGLAGIFLDEVAEATERRHYPDEPAGRPMPFAESLAATVRFTGLALLLNLLALPFVFVPGLGHVVFWLVNGFLISREYFAFAARRMLGPDEARALARRHSGSAFLAGAAASVLMSIPVANLATPLFATAVMVHLARLAARQTPEPRR
jgi:CysZ protein